MMRIVLSTLEGEQIATASITTDEHGYLYATHPTFGFEIDCALYGFQEGGVFTDTIDDDNGNPYIRWTVQLIWRRKTMTPNRAKQIAAALRVEPFSDPELRNATLNAQKALSGITHCCDPQNLRFHHARIVGASCVYSGAFFKVTETVAKNYQNTKRGYRVVLFDLTGGIAHRQSLEETYDTRIQAERAFQVWLDEFDQVKYYQKLISQQTRLLAGQMEALAECGRDLEDEQIIPEATC